MKDYLIRMVAIFGVMMLLVLIGPPIVGWIQVWPTWVQIGVFGLIVAALLALYFQ